MHDVFLNRRARSIPRFRDISSSRKYEIREMNKEMTRINFLASLGYVCMYV